MRVIIVGGGEVGEHIAGTLTGEGHEVTVIERDERRVAVLQARLDALVAAGNGARPKLLGEHGARDADLLLAVTGVDEVNMLAAAAADRLGTRRTLARVQSGEWDPHFVREVLGVDAMIDPERATADDLAETLLLPGAVHVEFFAGDRVALAEVAVPPSSPLVGRVVADRERVRPHSLVGVLRGGRPTIPAAHEEILAGDHVFIAAAKEDIAVVLRSFEPDLRPLREVVILGAGAVGVRLAQRLGERDLEVRLLEPDADRARAAAEALPHAVVLQDEALGRDVLEGHAVDGADAFVAAADDDRTNLLASLHAKRIGVPLCLAIVSSEQYVPLVDAMGIDAAFSLRLTVAEAILRFVRRDVVRAMHLTISGAQVLDLHADPGSPVVGQTPASELLAGCDIAAVVRGEDVVFPDDDHPIEAEDRVVLFRLQHAAPEVERAFDA